MSSPFAMVVEEDVVMERVPTFSPLTPTEVLIAEIAGLNYDWNQAADVMGMSRHMVRWHAARAAQKIPGDLPVQAKLSAWARGASLDVLRGTTLRYIVNRKTERWKNDYTARGVPPAQEKP